jgi:peptide/nickel transport system substrate-binding protein
MEEAAMARLLSRGRRGALGALALCTLAGCVYDRDRAPELLESRRLLPKDAEAEIQRILELSHASVVEDEHGVVRSVPDAFNDAVPQKWAPRQPAEGGSIRVQLESEPKRLTFNMDNSAVTRTIGGYFTRSLLYSQPETGDMLPDLAERWEAEDVLWLRGWRSDSIFEMRDKPSEPGTDNNYRIGTIVPGSIVWADESAGLVESLKLLEGGEIHEIRGEEMRMRQNADGSYKRMFDREVVFTFHLRHDARWHDGKSVTAEDVVFTLDIFKNPFIPELTSARGQFVSVKNWEAIGERTVRVYLDEQYSKALELFGDGDNFFNVLPKHVYWPEGQQMSQAELAKYFRDHPAIDEPLGNGPYVFPSARVLPHYNPHGLDGWRKNTYLRLLRTGDFYDPARRGYIDEIRFDFISSQAQTLQALQARDIDFTPRWLTSEDLFRKTLGADFKGRYVKGIYYIGNYSYIAFNLKKPYFQDVRVRRAFVMLLNRKSLLENLSYGVGIVVSGSQYYYGPGYDRSIQPWPYDRGAALELLNEAGWIDTDGDGIRDRDGLPFEVEFLASQASTLTESIAAVLAEELRTVGIGLSVRRLEWSSLLEHIDDRKFDLYSLAWSTALESDPFELWHSSQWADKGQNTPGYDNPEADRLIEAIRRELDEEKRYALHRQLHALLHEESPYIFLFCFPNRTAYNKRYRNVKFYPKRPGYFIEQWFIPEELQTPQERERARSRAQSISETQPRAQSAQES